MKKLQKLFSLALAFLLVAGFALNNVSAEEPVEEPIVEESTTEEPEVE